MNTTPFIVFINFTPLFILKFLVNFSDVVVLINSRYKFEDDPIFDLKGNYSEFKQYATLIKGLYWNAMKIDEKIKAGNKITDVDLQYEKKDNNLKVVEKVDITQLVNRYNTKKLPVLIIDATNMDSTAYIPVNKVKTYEMLKIGRPESTELVYKTFTEKEVEEEDEKSFVVPKFKKKSKKKPDLSLKKIKKTKSGILKKKKTSTQPKKEIDDEDYDSIDLSLVKQNAQIFEIQKEESGSDSGDSDFLD